MSKYNVILIIAVSAALDSCKTVTKVYHPPVISASMEQKLYRDVVTAGDTANLADVPWKEIFADTKLHVLIEEGLAYNLDLKNAIESINDARATFKESRLAFLPSLDFEPSISGSGSSRAALNFPPGININLKTTTYQLAFNSSWEIDIWGKLASARRSAMADLLRSEALKRAVQTQLIADIAAYYYALLAYDKELAVTEQSVTTYEKDVAAMKELKTAAKVNGAAVVQSEANLHAAEARIPDLKQSIRETEHAICLLLGKEPGAIERTTMDKQRMYEALKVGISVQLLRNRPDVASAELAFRSAFENTNIARTNFYPSLAITSGAGVSALAIRNLFSNSIFYSIVGGLTQPIFRKGANRSALTKAEAQQSIALNNFYKALLTAGHEVSNALFDYQAGVDKEAARQKQIASLTKAVQYTRELMIYTSSTNYTDVLFAEQSLLSAQLSVIGDRMQQFQAIVNLYKALGGGWKK